MKFCENCGNQLKDNAKFCSKCGTKQKELSEEVDSAVEKDTRDSASGTIEVQEKLVSEDVPKSGKKATRFLLVFVLLLVAAGGILFWQKDNIFGNSNFSSSKSKQEKIAAVKQTVMPFKNGDQIGLMNDKFEIIKENIGTGMTKFNKEGAAIVYDWEDDNGTYLMNESGEKFSDGFDSLGTFGYGDFDYSQLINLQSKNGVLDFTNEEYDSGLINSKGEIVREALPGFIYPFQGKDVTTFYDQSREKEGVISDSGETIIEAIYSQIIIIDADRFAVKRSYDDSSYKIINRKGEESGDTLSGDYLYQLPSGDFVITGMNGKSSILDERLNMVIESGFSSSPQITKNGKYMVASNSDYDKYMIYDRKGTPLFNQDYTYLGLPNEQGYLPYMINKEYGLINLKEEIIYQNFVSTDSEYVNMYRLNDNNVYVVSYSEKTKFLDHELNTIFESTYLDGNGYDGYVVIYPENYYGEGNGFIVTDRDGNMLSDSATFVWDLGDRLMIQEEKYVRLLSKKDYKEINAATLEFEPMDID